MQKKLIALAIAGLMSAPVFAQSSVVLYGSIDYGYTSLGSNDDKGIKNRHGIDSSISKTNRIGFKGTEDLGNGLKAMFVLESNLNGETDSMWQNARSRQSYGGFAGSFGTLTFGRQYTPQHSFASAVDPFGKNGFGSSGNVLMQDRRLDNLIVYVTPDFGGFKTLVGYTLDGYGNEAIENNGDTRVWTIAPSFTWNNLFVAANYHAVRINRDHGTNAGSLRVFDAYDLHASYDFGVVKLGSSIGRRTTEKGFVGTDKDVKLTQWMIGATFRITPHDSVMASYSRASENRVNGRDGRPRIGQWAIGYEHALSKRTVLYSQLALQSHNAPYKDYNFASYATDGAVGSVTSTNGPDVDGYPAQYRRGFAAGFRHDF
ncbi:MAG: porin [Azoarcus sp.]|nr:porin [Azoarcus sp.]